MSHVFRKITLWVGSTVGVGCGVGVLVAWLVGGLFFGFTSWYQLVGNTFMSAVSYVLLFVIQNSINRDSTALHLKLDELLLSVRKADNCLINVEELDEVQLAALVCRYKKIADSYRHGDDSASNSASK